MDSPVPGVTTGSVSPLIQSIALPCTVDNHNRNVPGTVWNYKLGGYQVLKKWLSYRERDILGRPMRPVEVQHFSDSARRIAAILRLVGTQK